MICCRNRMKANRGYKSKVQEYRETKGETRFCNLHRGYYTGDLRGKITMKGYAEYNTHIEYDDFGEYEEDLEM